MLSWITSKLDVETVRCILDGVTKGLTGRADIHDPVVALTDEAVHKQVWKIAVWARATNMHVNLHVTDWVAAQWEDAVHKTMIKWISNQKVQYLKHLFEDDANTEEGMAILWEQKRLKLYQGALYHCNTLAGELEEAMQFVVPKAHQVAIMNGCHRDAGHQGQHWTLYLLHDQFWWPSVAAQIQHGGTIAKVPIQPIIVASHLELLYIDFMNIEMTMELDQPPNVENALVFCDHFTKHIMVYMTPDQTAKTVAKL